MSRAASRTAAARATLLALLLLCILAPIPALADGDPASDVLPGQTVFLPYSPLSRAIEGRLFAICDAAARAGYPLRIALIDAPSDLGVVPGLFARPQAYARFLSAELAGVVNGPVLVAMPAGFGLAQEGRALPMTALAGIKPGVGADGLGVAALAGARRLAAAAGHPLPASLADFSPSAGASQATIRHALIAIAILLAFSAIATAFALRARSRRRAPSPARSA